MATHTRAMRGERTPPPESETEDTSPSRVDFYPMGQRPKQGYDANCTCGRQTPGSATDKGAPKAGAKPGEKLAPRRGHQGEERDRS